MVHPLLGSVRATVLREMPGLTASSEAEIDLIWDAAQPRMAAGGAGQLFNGRVFSADSITAGHIGGHLTEFRRIVAQIERPALFETLGVRPLAVCGALRCAGALSLVAAIAARSTKPACGNCRQPAAWMPAPSDLTPV